MKGKNNNNEDDYERGYLSKKKYKLDETAYQSTRGITIYDDNTYESNNEKGTAIYRLELKKLDEEVLKEEEENYFLRAVTRHYSNNVSGIMSLC